MSPLEQLLAAWLPEQRWYGGKGAEITSVSVSSQTQVLSGEPTVQHVVAEVTTARGVDRYQVLLGQRHGALGQRLQHAVLGELDGATAYDAVHDPEVSSALLAHLASGEALGELSFMSVGEIDPTLPGRVLTAEQSNTSVVYGDAAILKLFRRLQPGENPDIEVTRALAEAGSTHVPAPLGWFTGPVAGQETTLGLLQRFMTGASDGWASATNSVRDLFAEGDLRADEVGGDFASEAERLGRATAEVHLAMAEVLPTREVDASDFQATARQLAERARAAAADVPELVPHLPRLLALYEAFAGQSGTVTIQRIHGDLHLGQVLRTQDGWVLLDFEGEPARPLAERTTLMNPLRDVAGMLRSFDYAAHHLLAEGPGPSQLAYRALEWAGRNRSAFCDGYAAAAGHDPRDQPERLLAFELDKAVYEVLYEARNRPAWLSVPLGSIERILQEDT